MYSAWNKRRRSWLHETHFYFFQVIFSFYQNRRKALNKEFLAYLLEIITLVEPLLKVFLALPCFKMLIATLCIVVIIVIVTICAICWKLINKKNPFN
ncbi:hypothetical protein EGX20_11730 [Enterococcus faecium]|nr:hypothetical protein HMPREF1375_01734 [Enterococcus faecium P1986]ROY61907.1 hypothetical protein EGX20_11730 [Enterococcus faecium]